MPLVQDQINDLAGVDSPIEVKVFGPDFAKLRELAEQVGEIVEKVEGVADVNAHVYLGNPDVVVRPDSVQTARVGLTEMDIEAQLNAALYGQVASTVPEQDRMTKIRVRYPDRVRYDRERLGLLPISLATATPVRRGEPGRGDGRHGLRPARPARHDPDRPQPQRALARKPAAGDHRLRRAGEARPGLGQPRIARKAVEAQVPAGLPLGAGGELPGAAGVVRQPADGPDRGGGLVFLLLGFQFQSLTLPFLIFLAQPISLASALFALWITGTPLNVSSFMGAILLIGLDVKNGIILIEYIGQLREEGMPLHEALLKAGRTRFRPILMTSLCTILGLVPLALGLGPGAQMQQPLAIAVIGGLITNMLLTRLLIPVGYLAFEKIRAYINLAVEKIRAYIKDVAVV